MDSIRIPRTQKLSLPSHPSPLPPTHLRPLPLSILSDGNFFFDFPQVETHRFKQWPTAGLSYKLISQSVVSFGYFSRHHFAQQDLRCTFDEEWP